MEQIDCEQPGSGNCLEQDLVGLVAREEPSRSKGGVLADLTEASGRFAEALRVLELFPDL